MNRLLTDEQIRSTCRQLSQTTRKPTTRQVSSDLRKQYGACGRSERVGEILRAVLEERVPTTGTSLAAESRALKSELARANVRAVLSEKRERDHQDFYANQYAKKLAQFEARLAELQRVSRGVTAEQYLRLYQRAAELMHRLSKYENVEPLLPPTTTTGHGATSHQADHEE
jgi:hypothetical protein